MLGGSRPRRGAKDLQSDRDKKAAREARVRQRVEKAREMLTDGVAKLSATPEFRAYLKMLGRFHNYSSFNNLLIKYQAPGATRVASETAWKALGRTRISGEKPIRILAPRFRTFKVLNEETGEEETRREIDFRRWGTSSVYDVSQTEGDPLPVVPEPKPITSESPEAHTMAQRIASWCSSRGIEFEATEQEAEATWSAVNKRITIRRSLPADQRAFLFAREAARASLEDQGLYRDLEGLQERELAVTGAAYAIAAGMGIDAGDAVFPSLATIAPERKRFERVLRAIQKSTNDVLRIETAAEGPSAETA